MKSRKHHLSISSEDRFEKILLRERKLRNQLNSNINTPQDQPFLHKVDINERHSVKSTRQPRVIIMIDDSILLKKASRVLISHYPDVHIYEAENMAQALIEIEQREYDLIILNVEQHIMYPDLFIDVMQRQYPYLNILFVDKLPQSEKSTQVFEGNYFHLPEYLHSNAIARMYQKIFQKHAVFRNRVNGNKTGSPVEQKFLRMRHSA
ncbi:MAG: hypothetical protein WD334_03975 [Chitinophagales bacterium]